MSDNPSLSVLRRAETARQPSAAISLTDIATLIGLPLMLVIAWLVPERLWPRLCQAVAPLSMRMAFADPPAAIARIRRTLGDRRARATPEDILRGLAASQIRSLLLALKAYRPGGIDPEIRTAGLEGVAAALAQGRGAILWLTLTDLTNLAPKIAFHRAGLAYAQLTTAGHPFSDTLFGSHVLNPIVTAHDGRFLTDWIAMSHTNPSAALHDLEARLGENAIVCFAAHSQAKRPVVVPFLDGEITLGAGAPTMACRTKAPLFPVFPFRDAAGATTVTVGPQIEPRPNLPEDQAVADMTRQYAAALEPYALDYCEQWGGWPHL